MPAFDQPNLIQQVPDIVLPEVQGEDQAFADEEFHPEEQIELPLLRLDHREDDAGAAEEEAQNREEKPHGDPHDDLVHHHAQREDIYLRLDPRASAQADADGVVVDVVVQPFMHHGVPLAVVLREVRAVPPVLVEASVAVPEDLAPQVEPGVQQQEEPHDEEAQSRDGEPQGVIHEMRQAVVVSDFAHAEIGVAHVPD